MNLTTYIKTSELHDDFIRTNIYPKAKILAQSITGIINASPDLNQIKAFYLAINERFNPDFCNAIKEFDDV